MNPVVSTLIAERALLEEELKADPRHLKIQKINELLEVYGVTNEQIANELAKEFDRQLAKRRAAPTRADSKEALIRQKINGYLKLHGPSHRTAILEYLKNAGLMGGEKDPMQRLAIYKSRMPEIITDGTGIWRLTELMDNGTDDPGLELGEMFGAERESGQSN